MAGRPLRAAKRLLRNPRGLTPPQIRDLCTFVSQHEARRNPEEGGMSAKTFISRYYRFLDKLTSGGGQGRGGDPGRQDLFADLAEHLLDLDTPSGGLSAKRWKEEARTGTADLRREAATWAERHEHALPAGMKKEIHVEGYHLGAYARGETDASLTFDDSRSRGAFVLNYIKEKPPIQQRALALAFYSMLEDFLVRDRYALKVAARAGSPAERKQAAQEIETVDKDLQALKRARPPARLGIEEPEIGDHRYSAEAIAETLSGELDYAAVRGLIRSLRRELTTWQRQRRTHGPAAAAAERQRFHPWGST